MKNGRLWTYVRDDRNAGSTQAPAVWFADSTGRKGLHPRTHLAGFYGVLQADAYAGFNELYRAGHIKETACWIHAQRKIHDVHTAPPRRRLLIGSISCMPSKPSYADYRQRSSWLNVNWGRTSCWTSWKGGCGKKWRRWQRRSLMPWTNGQHWHTMWKTAGQKRTITLPRMRCGWSAGGAKTPYSSVPITAENGGAVVRVDRDMPTEWYRSWKLPAPYTECDRRLAGKPSWWSSSVASKPANRINYLAAVNMALAVRIHNVSAPKGSHFR